MRAIVNAICRWPVEQKRKRDQEVVSEKHLTKRVWLSTCFLSMSLTVNQLIIPWQLYSICRFHSKYWDVSSFPFHLQSVCACRDDMEGWKIPRVPHAACRLGSELCGRRLLLYILLHVSCHLCSSPAVHNAHTFEHSLVPRDEIGAAEKTKALRQVL